MSLKFGSEPYLECSSKGDKRFSAFYARVDYHGVTKSIEEWYQCHKILPDGTRVRNWRDGKGKLAINIDECRALYEGCWKKYFEQNPELLDVIKEYNGFSDVYGQEGHACQAEEIYRVWNSLKNN